MLTFDSDAQPFGATQEERTEEQILRGSSAEVVLDILRANWVMSILLVYFLGLAAFPIVLSLAPCMAFVWNYAWCW